MKSAAGFRLFGFAIAVLLLSILAAPIVKAADQPLPAGANKMCPVMTDQPTRADRFIDYNGKRIYFCCDKCMARFQQNPAKYISNLDGNSGLPSSAGSSAQTTQPTEASSPGTVQRFHSPLWQLFGRLHVVIVHFPIALIILAGAIEFFRLRKTSPSDAARFCLTFGAIAAVMAACMGWVDAANQFGANPPKELMYHRWLGISFASVAIVVTALAYLARSNPSRNLIRTYRFGVIFCAAGIGLVGHFGGMLTYGDDYFTAIFKTNPPNNSPQPTAMPMASAVTPVASATTQPSDDLQNALVFGTAEQVRQARIKIRLAASTSEPIPPTVSLPTNNPIDQFIVAKWESAKLPESQQQPQLCDDATFVRRVYLDVIGMIPTMAESQQFVADQTPKKRAKLIDDLLARNDDYAANLTPWFEEGIASTDVEQEGGVRLHGNYKSWIVESFKTDRPYDVMVSQLIDPTEPGYVKRAPVAVLGQSIPVGYVLNDTHKDALQTAANFGQFFLGTGMNASCHSHFTNDEWPQARFTAFASMFCDRNLELIRCEKPTGKIADAAYPFKLPGAPTTLPSEVNDRLHLVAKLTTDPANPRFARTTVNRLWRRYLGLGLFEPIDDYRLDSPAANPELLDWLAYDFVQNGYDLKHTIRLILNSRTYQLKYDPKLEDHFDLAKRDLPRYWRSPTLRKLTAEELIDSIRVATSQQDLPDAQRMYHQTESTDLSRSLGRPSSREEIATARPDDVAVVQSLELMNGNEWSGLLYGSAIVHDMMYESDPVKVTQTFYEAALSRSAKPDEVTIGEEFLKSAPATQPAAQRETDLLPPRSFFAASEQPVKNAPPALGDMLWALVTSPEFQYVH